MLVSYLPFRLAQKHYFQSGRQAGRGIGAEWEGGREGGCRTAAIWRLSNRRCTTDVRVARDRLGLQLLRLVANNSRYTSFPRPSLARTRYLSPLTTPIAVRVSVTYEVEPRCNGNTTTLTARIVADTCVNVRKRMSNCKCSTAPMLHGATR